MHLKCRFISAKMSDVVVKTTEDTLLQNTWSTSWDTSTDLHRHGMRRCRKRIPSRNTSRFCSFNQRLTTGFSSVTVCYFFVHLSWSRSLDQLLDLHVESFAIQLLKSCLHQFLDMWRLTLHKLLQWLLLGYPIESFNKHDGNLNGDVLRNKRSVHTKQRERIISSPNGLINKVLVLYNKQRHWEHLYVFTTTWTCWEMRAVC